MNRQEKEQFIQKAWVQFRQAGEPIEPPLLTFMDEQLIDCMVQYFQGCYEGKMVS